MGDDAYRQLLAMGIPVSIPTDTGLNHGRNNAPNNASSINSVGASVDGMVFTEGPYRGHAVPPGFVAWCQAMAQMNNANMNNMNINSVNMNNMDVNTVNMSDQLAARVDQLTLSPTQTQPTQAHLLQPTQQAHLLHPHPMHPMQQPMQSHPMKQHPMQHLSSQQHPIPSQSQARSIPSQQHSHPMQSQARPMQPQARPMQPLPIQSQHPIASHSSIRPAFRRYDRDFPPAPFLDGPFTAAINALCHNHLLPLDHEPPLFHAALNHLANLFASILACPRLKLYPFGSTANGLCLRGAADMDLCLSVEPNDLRPFDSMNDAAHDMLMEQYHADVKEYELYLTAHPNQHRTLYLQ